MEFFFTQFLHKKFYKKNEQLAHKMSVL